MRLTLALSAGLATTCCTYSFSRHISVATVQAAEGRFEIRHGDGELFQVYKFRHIPIVPFAYGGSSFVWEAPAGAIVSGVNLAVPSESTHATLFRFGHAVHRVPTELIGSISVQKCNAARVIAFVDVRTPDGSWHYRGKVRYPTVEFTDAFHQKRSRNSRSNNGVNLTVRPVTALAEGASAAPVRPAGYAER